METIANYVYSHFPEKPLFHYTSLESICGIAQDKCLWASDINYFSDSDEMKHFAKILIIEVNKRLATKQKGTCPEGEVLAQFKKWLAERLPNGNRVFVTSFTANGNLISQWRGYCKPGKGVSIGLKPELITACAKENDFQLGRCIYQKEEKRILANKIVEEVIQLANIRGQEKDKSLRHPSQSYHGIFEEFENQLLIISALAKNPAFAEEEEWRAVSTPISDYKNAPIKYRVGASMLVPYINFPIIKRDQTHLSLYKVYVGPSPNPGLSHVSLSMFLSKNSKGQYSIESCGIPYRTW